MASRRSSAKSRPGSSRPSIEYYMRPESRMSEIPKPTHEEGESKAQFAWRLIRQCVREAIDLTLKADIKDLMVHHGVHHSKRLMHVDPIQQMLINKNTREYLTLDGKVLRVYHPDGRKKEVITPDNPFNRLVHAYTQHLYIGWSHGEDELILMDEEFKLQSCSQSQGPILGAIFNENIHEIITVGPGYLTSWVFRYGGRHLLPRKTAEEGLSEKDRFHLVVVEETLSRSQKAFAACGTSVAVFNLFEGKLLKHKKELHTRNITSLLFFNPLKYLITGAKDGTIKVWNSQWNLQLVFVGHSLAVTSLSVYPYGPSIMSGSLDKTIRVWSLETCDEVDLCNTQDPVRFLGALLNHPYFYSISHNHADIWKVENIHTFHTRVGHRVNLLKSTDHPEYPIRNLLLCKDASVRIVTPSTGDVITTLLMPPKKLLVDAAYAIAQEKLYACFGNGNIIVADTTTNPCTVLDEWKCPNPGMACNYLLMYEYVITADVGADMWASIKRMAKTKQKMDTVSSVSGSDSTRSTPQPMTPKTGAPTSASTGANANRTLLLGGRKDGHICVFNMQTGDIEFEIEAHGSRGVLSMIANSKADQLISSGLDNLIKIWRLYPYAQESLAPLMTLYCAHTPIFMCMMKTKLAVAFQDHTTATYSIVMYNLKNRNRQDHGAEEDHIDSITGITGCTKLKLLASCSHDGTIKIWNEMNSLVRMIRLNATPHSLTFCSEKGDMLVGIGDHVHKIDYKTYMPKAYRFKMISIGFSDVQTENGLPYNENLVNQMSKEDQRRLKAARASFKFTHFVDILTEEETEEVMREKNQKTQAFNALAAREDELMKMMKGEIQPSKPKLKPTASRKREAFDRYLKVFYNRPKPKLYVEEDYDIEDKVKLLLEGPPPKVEAPWEPEREPTGFFPPKGELARLSQLEKWRLEEVKRLEQERKEAEEQEARDREAREREARELEAIEREAMERAAKAKEAKAAQQLALPPPLPLQKEKSHGVRTTVPTPATPIRGDGYVPNSVLTKILYGRDDTKDSMDRPLKTEWRPPKMTQAQLDQIANLNTKLFKQEDPDEKVINEDLEALDLEHLTEMDHLSVYPQSTSLSQKFAREGTERVMVLDWDTDDEKKTPTPRDQEEDEDQWEADFDKEPSALLAKALTNIEKEQEFNSEEEDVDGALPSPAFSTPPLSRTGSRPGSRPSSRPNSGSRGPSPLAKQMRERLQSSLLGPIAERTMEGERTDSSVSSLNKLPTWMRDDLARTPESFNMEEHGISEHSTPADKFFMTGLDEDEEKAKEKEREPSAQESTASSKAGAQRSTKPAAKQMVKYVSTFKPAPPPPSSKDQASSKTTSQRGTVGAGSMSSPPGSVRSASPARPKTPLPDFITQFKGREWFDKYFPNANENTMPKPWTVTAFMTMLVRVLRIADFAHKLDIMDGILSIYMSEGISVTEPIYKVLYSLLNHHTHRPTCVVEVEKSFIRKAIELLQLLGVHDRDFFIELMVQFLDGDKDIRNQVFEAMNVAGLRDQHNYFKKELDGWDVWNLDEKDRAGELRRMCKDWLDRWMTSFKIHVEDALDRIKKGQTVHGRATPGTIPSAGSRASPAPRSAPKGILKRLSLPGLIEEGDETTPGLEAEDSRLATTVTFEKAPELSDLENATYMDAVNYFCDMQLDKELEKIKSGGRVQDKSGEEKNTVLVLPKIPGKATLVRLGETHTSKCRPHRETALSSDLRLPPITDRGYQPLPGQLYGFPKCISLPMKQVMMNPFPCALDVFDPTYTMQKPVLLMLKTSQKYFVQERSVVVPDVIY